MSTSSEVALSAAGAAGYLQARGYDPWRITELGGGVSNTVLLVETGAGRFVLKQALQRLRVEQEWLSDRGRVFRESEALRVLAPHLPEGTLPRVLFEDRDNFIFAMTAAPEASASWKDQLLAGEIREETAGQVARLLAAMIVASRGGGEWERVFGDQTVFDQLRLDPYYRSTAACHPDLRVHFDRLLEETAARRVSLVHGDWSPKNFLVDGKSVMAIDFEVIHYGDPSFDAAFLLNHFLLKAFFRPQWKAEYRRSAMHFWKSLSASLPAESAWLEAATVRHLGCLLLARVDGKSPAEYLRDDSLRERVREFARGLILSPAGSVAEVFESR